MLRVIISHWFGSAGIRTPDLPHGKPALFWFECFLDYTSPVLPLTILHGEKTGFQLGKDSKDDSQQLGREEALNASNGTGELIILIHLLQRWCAQINLQYSCLLLSLCKRRIQAQKPTNTIQVEMKSGLPLLSGNCHHSDSQICLLAESDTYPM